MTNQPIPPKDRDFLALVDDGDNVYWDVFFWATKKDGVGSKSCFVDRNLNDMPNIREWIFLPNIARI